MNIYELIKGEPLLCLLRQMNFDFIDIIITIIMSVDRRSYLPESQVKLYMYQLCKSIYHMHRNGIFHRDVKPENILIKVRDMHYNGGYLVS